MKGAKIEYHKRRKHLSMMNNIIETRNK